MTGGAVAICGASAALAIAAVIPPNDKTERITLFTVMTVTALSTIAMVAYPLLFLALVGLGSAVELPGVVVEQVDRFSRACLITAIAALGVKTSLKALTAVGGGHLAIVVVETLALLPLASTALYLLAIV